MSTMQAWRVRSLADPPSLTRESISVPHPGAGELLVKVAHAALNFSDLLMVRGTYQVKPSLPFTPGQELAGIVTASGSGTRIAAGARVASKVLWGAFADYAIVREDMAIELPADVSLAQGATIPVVWPTASIGLFERGGLRAGETVLVLSAAGGVGTPAVQLAKAAGARVIAATRGAEKLAYCRSLGADVAIDYAARDWSEEVLRATEGRGADLVFDPVGGELGEASVKCLSWGGRLLVVGFASGTIPAIRTNRLLLRNASLIGVYWSHDKDPAVVARALDGIFAFHRVGKVRFGIGRQYPFDELPSALAALAARRTVAKSLLSLDGDQV